jgi:hypothetical protein
VNAACAHPKEKRSLLDGYEVVCECGESVGRVAPFGASVVLSASEAQELLSRGVRPQSNIEAKLRSAVEFRTAQIAVRQ